jgi:para-aminobenzoate synthetase component II
MPDILIIDNIDSFTYNLVHLCHRMLLESTGDTGAIEVFRPGQISLDEIEDKHPTLILISPGPGTPGEAHFSKAVISRFAGEIPIFGVCLGMQAIAECFEAQVGRGEPVHGKKWDIKHPENHPMFQEIPSPFEVVRYHSLQVIPCSVEKSGIRPLAWTREGTIMALESTEKPMVWGVQFHPESIGSSFGVALLGNVYTAASRFCMAVPKLKSIDSSCSRI